MFGKPTYFGPRCKAPTTLDYGLIHANALRDVVTFRVNDYCYLSDHCLIGLQLRTGTYNAGLIPPEEINMSEVPQKFIWEDNRSGLFISNLKSSDSVLQIEEFMNENWPLNQDTSNLAADKLGDIIRSAAEKTFKRTIIRSTKPKHPKHGKPFDKDCSIIAHEVKTMARKVGRDPGNGELRKLFYLKKKFLKRVVKFKLKTYRDEIVDKLSKANGEPNEFWKLVDKLHQATNGKKKEPNDVPAPKWVKHFRELTCKEPSIKTAKQLEIEQYVENKDNWHIFNELNFKITVSEIKGAVKNLKRNKACAADLILNEMIKAACPTLMEPMQKLFNLTLQAGCFPLPWSISWLKPLHKGGDTKDPNRYRGISIMSCMGKLYCSILNNRLVKHLKQNNLNSKFQIGFEKDRRTSDHILTIKTLTDKYNQENKKLYACFVDFKKAFDSVWRKGLFYKLLKNGIGGNIGRSIESMYSRADTCIKLGNQITNPLVTKIGVKQGCVLSPTLFKLFINDLPQIFDKECNPAQLYNLAVQCLLFADDLVLLSETPEGLQRSLDKLNEYCKKWLLEINPDKTKIVIFNKAGRTIKDHKFNYNGYNIESVGSYTYLGIIFSPSGSLSNAITNLCNKATKAMFKLRNSLFKTDINPSLAMKLFDSLIRPITTYGAEIWGAFINDIPNMLDLDKNNYNITDNKCYEKLDLRFSKSILGVHRKASNIGTRGELGRIPISLHITKLMLKNWLRIAEYDKNTVLYDAYLANLNMLSENKKCWLFNIRNIVVDKLGETHLWENQGSTRNNIVKKVMSTAVNIFKTKWYNALNKDQNQSGDRNKLRTYNTYKTYFEYENYLKFSKNFRHRRLI
jgi:hypothetical protein